MSAINYEGKVVIITGSSSGIGQAAAVLFAKAGASVTIHGRSEEGLQKTSDLIQKAGVLKERIHSVKGAVTDSEVLKALINETVSKFGKIDVLINNVGIAGKEGVQNPRSMENFDYVLGVNLRSIVELTELAIPQLEKTKGNVINVSSISSTKTHLTMPFYCIAKSGLDHFARNYAAILAPKGIRINNLNPGATDTAIYSRTGDPPEFTEKMHKFIEKLIPFRRYGTPSEMGEFLVFMASEKASYMTGQCINVDGGILISAPKHKL